MLFAEDPRSVFGDNIIPASTAKFDHASHSVSSSAAYNGGDIPSTTTDKVTRGRKWMKLRIVIDSNSQSVIFVKPAFYTNPGPPSSENYAISEA